MFSLSSETPIALPTSDGSLNPPKIATSTNNTIDRHLARIVTGNAGKCERNLSFERMKKKPNNFFLENLRAHLDPMYKLLRPDDRLTLVCSNENTSRRSLHDLFLSRWSNWKVVFLIAFVI